MIHWVLYKASDSTRHPCTPNTFSSPHRRRLFTRSFDSDALQSPDRTPLHHRQNPSDTHDAHQPNFSKAWLRNFNNWAEPYVAGTVPYGNAWSFGFFLGGVWHSDGWVVNPLKRQFRNRSLTGFPNCSLSGLVCQTPQVSLGEKEKISN